MWPCHNHQPNEKLPLFDSPASHTGDPVTSFIAEEKVTKNGTRQKQCQEVLGVLKRHNGRTSAEMGEILDDRYLPARRLPDLRSKGFVRNCKDGCSMAVCIGGECPNVNTRFCAASKSQCITWWVVKEREAENG